MNVDKNKENVNPGQENLSSKNVSSVKIVENSQKINSPKPVDKNKLKRKIATFQGDLW